MLAKTNQYFEDAVATVRQLTQEEKSDSSAKHARIITGVPQGGKTSQKDYSGV